jgi:hypothetical protein
MIEKIYLVVYRGFLLIAFLLLLLPIFERFLLAIGYRLSFISFGPGKILEYAAIFALFTILLLLRQIRDQQKK